MLSFQYRSADGPKIPRLGIYEEHVELPALSPGLKVLDVRAGSGLLAKKMRDTYDADVYALEPSFERGSDYESCVDKLGPDNVDKLTLQEAIETKPAKYKGQFDAITVFKYNVPYLQKESFIMHLAMALKPDGVIYITSVEKDRFIEGSRSAEALYLLPLLRRYFKSVSEPRLRRSGHEADLIIELRESMLVSELSRGTHIVYGKVGDYKNRDHDESKGSDI